MNTHKDHQRIFEESVVESAVTTLAFDLKKIHLDELLDEALKGSFPASDPTSVGSSN